MISNFEADVNYLHNPTLISQYFSLLNFEKVPQFWKWGALFIAILATFSSLIKRIIKLIFIYIRRIKPCSAEPIIQYLSEDFDFSDDDDDECSSVSSNDEELISPSVSSMDQQRGDGDFSVAGRGQKSNIRLRRRRSSYELFPLTEFVAGKSVVKLWESNFFTVKSPAMIFAEKIGDFCAAYDTRMRRQSPAICAEWGTGKVVGIGEIEKVYFRDEVTGILKVGDLRKAKMPVETVTVTENDGDRWRDAGAVIVDDDFVDCSK